MNISVIICTHNPREGYLKRVLDALDGQTLTKKHWELLLIDNTSGEPLVRKWDISWHPYARHIREDELGLTPARLRGTREAKGELLVFVDDDNVLEAGFLEEAWRIKLDYPHLGCWGGSCRPEFETPPAQRLKQYLPVLALREVTTIRWANFGLKSLPVGAGLCMHIKVAEAYLQRCAQNKIGVSLDRRGASLMGGGDFDMAMTAYQLGLGAGLFPSLKLWHLIPSRRVQRRYLFNLALDSRASVLMAVYLHTGEMPMQVGSFQILKQIIKIALCRPGAVCGYAGLLGRIKARRLIANNEGSAR